MYLSTVQTCFRARQQFASRKSLGVPATNHSLVVVHDPLHERTIAGEHPGEGLKQWQDNKLKEPNLHAIQHIPFYYYGIIMIMIMIQYDSACQSDHG